MLAATGHKLTDVDAAVKRLRAVVHVIWTSVVTVSSNFARTHAVYIGMAASMQLITTRVSSGVYRGAWNATPKGIAWLNETEED